VISVSTDDLLPHVFATLMEQKILSLPVIDARLVPVGFVDIIDVLTFSLEVRDLPCAIQMLNN